MGVVERQEALTRVLALTRRLAEHFELEELLADALALGMELFEAEAGALWLYNAAAEELVTLLPRLEAPLRARVGEGLVGLCAQQRRIVNVLDAAADPRHAGFIDRVSGFVTRSLLNVPVVARDGALIGVLQFLDEQLAGYDEHDEHLAAVLAAQCAVAMQHARVHARLQQSERLYEEVELARQIQISTLPTEMPQIPGYDVHGHFQPAGHAGGDLYDLVILEGRLFLLLGDATGHGFGPALSATQMQGMLRVAFRCGADLDRAYLHVNNQLAEDLPEDRFITAFMGLLDPREHLLRFHSGGQGPILHYRAAERRIDWHQPTSFPVGILEIDEPGQAAVLALAPGDVLAVISDGLYEYPGADGQLFGEQRVAALVEAGRELPMAELSRRLLDEVRSFGGDAEQADDVTIVLLKRAQDLPDP